MLRLLNIFASYNTTVNIFNVLFKYSSLPAHASMSVCFVLMDKFFKFFTEELNFLLGADGSFRSLSSTHIHVKRNFGINKLL